MQPFDALTMRASLQEAKSLLLNRRVDKVYQVARDEIILSFRAKTGPGYFLLSAHATFGRLCLVANPNLPKHSNPPAFCQALRKHLTSAIIVDIQQVAGERVADFIFSCTDELGTKTIKVLTAEVMGRHSNLIFWDKETEKIIGASHVVTAEMSRHREIATNLRYVRPPQQYKPNIFSVTREEFANLFSTIDSSSAQIETLAHWLLVSFAGIGRTLADEIIEATELPVSKPEASDAHVRDALWQRISTLQKLDGFKAAMRTDLTKYTVLSWWPELTADPTNSDWKHFPSVNEMVNTYFRALQQREQLQQLKDRIRSELKSESEKVQSRVTAAANQLQTAKDLDLLKKYGDLLLANSSSVEPGQTELYVDDLYANEAGNAPIATLTIAINPSLSPAQNAQNYYRQFAKGRLRKEAASAALADAESRLATIQEHLDNLEQAIGSEEINRLKEIVLDRAKRSDSQRLAPPPSGPGARQQRPQGGGPGPGGTAKGPRLMSTKTTEGWLIYIGRNRIENDLLLSRLAQPHDLWFHIAGQEGAHVLIKNPNKQDPPMTTVKEAAQIAARFSKIDLGSKVRVIYTHCKYVRKLGKDKPGMVRYENEKTVEVDTSAPMPPGLRRLFER